MSFWAKLGVQINDLGCFKQSCEQHGITYEENTDPNFNWQGSPVHAILRDTQGSSTAYLVRDGGGYRVAIDTDAHYSSITRRLGRNGGKLTRDYAAAVVKKGIRKSGGMINRYTEEPDGRIVIKVGVAA